MFCARSTLCDKIYAGPCRGFSLLGSLARPLLPRAHTANQASHQKGFGRVANPCSFSQENILGCVGKTQQFVDDVMGPATRRPWNEWYPMLDNASIEILDQASGVLTCPAKIATSLNNINVKIGDYVACKHYSTFAPALDDVLADMEAETGFFGPVRVLDETLSADDFMDFVRTGAPFVDIGVSVFHGSQTHRLQRQILVDHLGHSQAAEVMKVIATPGTFRPHPRDCNRHLTIWSELLDSAVPFNYRNSNARKVRDIFSTECEPVETNDMYFPVLDGRSAEWLQCLLISAPFECFGLLTRAVSEEIHKAARLDEIHHNIFATGLERYHPDVRKAYKDFGFVLPRKDVNRQKMDCL